MGKSRRYVYTFSDTTVLCLSVPYGKVRNVLEVHNNGPENRYSGCMGR